VRGFPVPLAVAGQAFCRIRFYSFLVIHAEKQSVSGNDSTLDTDLSAPSANLLLA